MKSYRLTMQQIDAYGRHLLAEERSAGTVAKYLRDAKAFLQWLSCLLYTSDAADE